MATIGRGEPAVVLSAGDRLWLKLTARDEDGLIPWVNGKLEAGFDRSELVRRGLEQLQAEETNPLVMRVSLPETVALRLLPYIRLKAAAGITPQELIILALERLMEGEMNPELPRGLDRESLARWVYNTITGAGTDVPLEVIGEKARGLGEAVGASETSLHELDGLLTQMTLEEDDE